MDKKGEIKQKKSALTSENLNDVAGGFSFQKFAEDFKSGLGLVNSTLSTAKDVLGAAGDAKKKISGGDNDPFEIEDWD